MKISEFLRYCAPRQQLGCCGHAIELNFRGVYWHYLRLLKIDQDAGETFEGWTKEAHVLSLYLAAAIAESEGQ